MKDVDDRNQQIEALRNRLSKLSEASLRINESLDFDTVLQEILDSARSLTNAQYGVIAIFDDAGQVEDFLASGLTADETQQLREATKEMTLCKISGPWRVRDFASYTRVLGIPEFRLPTEMNSFLVAPIRHQGVGVGNIYLAKSEPRQEFTREDEETLVMFASQAAQVIGNVRRYRDERRARANLETLINTSPVGVVVFDARTGVLVSFNREVRRIIGVLQTPGSPVEQLLDMVTVRRADGREIGLAEYPIAQVLSTGEIVRAEEIVIQVPDGRSVTTLVNAKPFSPTELVARVRAALRRQAGPYRAELSEPYVLGDLTIDYAERRVTVAGQPVQLTAAEYKLLFELSVNGGRVLTHDQLLREVWGLTNAGDVRVIRSLVRRLRRKLGDDASSPTYIFAEPRVGYRMPKGQEPREGTE